MGVILHVVLPPRVLDVVRRLQCGATRAGVRRGRGEKDLTCAKQLHPTARRAFVTVLSDDMLFFNRFCPVWRELIAGSPAMCRSTKEQVLRPLIPPKKARPPFDGVASLVVDRGAGTGLGPNFWSSPAWVL